MLVIDSLVVKRDNKPLNYQQTINSGEIVTLQGRSGVGKTTLLLTLAGFVKADSGSVIWHQLDLLSQAAELRPVSILFQEHNLFEHISAYDNACLGMGKSSQQAKQKTALKTRIMQAATVLQIDSYLHKKPSELSGGQRQRVALMRTLLRPEPLVLLDEPFAELDPNTRAIALDWTRQTAKAQAKTVLMVTHDDDDVAAIADRNWLLSSE